MNNFGKFFGQYGWTLVIFLALMIAHVILSSTLQNASSFVESYSVLMIATWLGLLILMFMLIRQSLRLWAQLRQKRPGARITARLTLSATLLMSIPALTIYLFSVNFIQQGINQWFDVKTETALENAATLTRLSLDYQTRQTLNLTTALSEDLLDELTITPVNAVAQIRHLTDAQEVALYQASSQQLIAFSSQDSSQMLPNSPGDHLFQQARQKKPYAAIESSTELSEEFIRIFIPISTSFLGTPSALQVIVPLSANLSQLSNSVATAAGQYRELSYLKGPLTNSFILILSTLVFLTIATAMLFTVRAINNFTSPIRRLARGTKAVTEGDYGVKVKVDSEDEFGDLARSFNDMTARISQARNDIKLGEQRSVLQRLYLEAILQNLNSGVITLDTNHTIKTNNHASEEILDFTLNEHSGDELEQIIQSVQSERPLLAELLKKIMPSFQTALAEQKLTWSQQIEYHSRQGQKILMMSGSTLTHHDSTIAGYVVVIDDITELVQAQLNAAWSDVARRLAHEIKNPLTPIQLSAERLNFKLYAKLNAQDQDLLERMTKTIVEQVSNMKSLVQAFSDYANTPEVTLQPFAMNHLIESVAEMYADNQRQWQPTLNLSEQNPLILADSGRLRQLLHNLIKNALEATEEQQTVEVTISTHLEHEQLQLRICDNGPGLPQQSQNWIFEPYATDKPKGTGLGLAIVRKIVDEHHGQIHVETSPQQGCCFIISFPTVQRDAL